MESVAKRIHDVAKAKAMEQKKHYREQQKEAQM